MISTKQLSKRIKRITGTRKITKAMEMIASSKIRIDQRRILEARPFIDKIEDSLTDIACYSNVRHPLLTPHKQVNKILVMGITADRGLCGGYNSNIIRLIERILKKIKEDGRDYKLDIIGTKGKNYFRYRGYDINRVYENLSDHPKFLDAREIAEEIITEYITGSVDEVVICYTKFTSPAEQKARAIELLPIPFLEKMEEIDDLENKIGLVNLGDRVCRLVPEFLYDPSPEAVLESLLPSYIYTIVYMSLLESTASETGARMTAMKSASDNAGDMIKELEVKFNRTRQQLITIEISEIISGSEALSESHYN